MKKKKKGYGEFTEKWILKLCKNLKSEKMLIFTHDKKNVNEKYWKKFLALKLSSLIMQYVWWACDGTVISHVLLVKD